jgi:hypothetical protein
MTDWALNKYMLYLQGLHRKTKLGSGDGAGGGKSCSMGFSSHCVFLMLVTWFQAEYAQIVEHSQEQQIVCRSNRTFIGTTDIRQNNRTFRVTKDLSKEQQNIHRNNRHSPEQQNIQSNKRTFKGTTEHS